MRHISPRWVFIIVGFLLLAVSDFADSALLLIIGVLLISYGLFGDSPASNDIGDEEFRITEETHYFSQEDEDLS
ncbi:MAG: hypothetical protein MJY97_11030 [Bacteroidales bacterium]|nr:hypothetical protein [Bacteroidales bacterium]